MSVVLFLVVAFVFIGWRVRKRKRASELAGLTGEKPVFSVEPPARRMGSRKDELL